LFANLEGLWDESELPKQAVHLEDTPFTSMGITRNDKHHAHEDDDALLGFIIWFTKNVFMVYNMLFYNKSFIYTMFECVQIILSLIFLREVANLCFPTTNCIFNHI
jgi:hypothetical protein